MVATDAPNLCIIYGHCFLREQSTTRMEWTCL